MKHINIILIIFAIVSNIFSQNYLTHNTGVFKVSVFDDGNIGHIDDTGTGGDGIIYNNLSDAIFSAGFIFGSQARGEVNGQLGSFRIYSDLVNAAPLAGFNSDTQFDEIATTEFDDSGAPNPYGVLIKQTTSSTNGDTIVFVKYEVSGSDSAISNLFLGMFADWDIGGSDYATNLGGYDASRNLAYEFGSAGKSDENYYGIVALDGMSGAKVTADNSTSTIRTLSFDRISSFQNETISNPGDYRMWIGSGPFTLSVGGKIIANFAIIASKSFDGLKHCADIAISKYNSSLPVELTGFSAKSVNEKVELLWQTATEVNNYGFEIQRHNSEIGSKWTKVGFVSGNGNSNSTKMYSFIDKAIEKSGNYFYRLKQIDVDGSYEYSDEIEAHVASPTEFELIQNYPNPFNPITTITFKLAEASYVKLEVFNTLGKRIKTLVNNELVPGVYHKSFDGSNLSSGTYFYVLRSNTQTIVRKMTLMK